MAKKKVKGLDPVGEEDADVNNNGVDNDPSDKFIMNRRRKISKAMAKNREDSSQDLFVDEVMSRVEESQLLMEQEVVNLCESVDETYTIFGVNFNSMNESTDETILSLLENYDDLDDGEVLGGICEALDLDPYDLSDQQLNEFFGMFKNRARAARSDALAKRMTRKLGGKENALARAKARLQARRIAKENPDGTMAGRRASRDPKGGKVVTKKIGDTTMRRNTASVFNPRSGKNNPDRQAKAQATRDNPLNKAGAKADYYASVRKAAQAAKRRSLGRPGEAQKADTTPAVRAGGMRKAKKAMTASTDIVRGARLALAERVLDQLLEEDVPKKLRKTKKDPAAEKARLRTIMYGHPKGGTAIKQGQQAPKPKQ